MIHSILTPSDPWSSERGAAFFLVIVWSSVLSILGISYLAASYQGYVNVRRNVERERAFQVAEAGLQLAIAEMRAGTDLSDDGIGNVTGGALDGTFQSIVGPDFNGTGEYRVRVSGVYGSATRVIEAMVGKDFPLFRGAVFADRPIQIGSSAFIDSYDSSLGSYSSQAVNVVPGKGIVYARANGDIGSNEAIVLSSSVKIIGDSAAGPGSQTVEIGGSTYVHGSTTSSSEERVVPAVTYEPPIPTSGNRTLNGSTVLNLNAGDFRYTNLTLLSNAIINVNGTVNVYVDNNVLVDGSAKIVVNPGGHLRLMHGTGTITIGGSGLVNQSGRPAMCEIISATASSILLNSSLDMCATINAPNASLSGNSSVNFFGAMVVGRMTLNSSMRIHYDESLGSGENDTFELRQLMEVSPTLAGVSPTK